MAITLVTGLPGHGKTLYTIARWKAIGEQEGRPVFFSGIKGLTLQWQEWEPEKWQELPPKSIFIIDEAQFRLKVHGRGQLPDWIEKLSVHRHGGIDIVLITQQPMNLDPFVRRLVDRHFHVMRPFGLQRAIVHEFPMGVNENPGKSRAGSIRHDWKYPKDVFNWYHSAEVHTVKRRIPARIWIGVAAVLGFAALSWVAYTRMKPGNETLKPEVVKLGGAASPGPAGAGGPPGMVGRNQALTPAQYVEAYQPRLPGLPHTAPAYDSVAAPREAPYPAACISTAKRCQCYTQQATKMDMTDQLCRQLAEGGFFRAWASNGDRVPMQSLPAASQAAQPTQARAFSDRPAFVAQATDPDAGSLPRRVRRVAQ